MLDRDLARLYGVETFRLNEQVKRNKERFPDDFMFKLTREEAESSRSQFAMLNDDSISSQNARTSSSSEDFKLKRNKILNETFRIVAQVARQLKM